MTPGTPAPPYGVSPRNESELLSHRPSSHREGVFPRRLLEPGERILFEARPSFLSYRRWLLSALLVLIFLNALGAVVLATGAETPATPGTSSAVDAAAGALVIGVWLAAIGLLVLGWRRTAFALTQRRVLWVKGFLGSSFLFAEWTSIARLVPPHGATDDLRFEIVRPVSGAGPSRLATETIVWRSVAHAPRVYEFTQTAFALQGSREQTRERDRRLRERALVGRGVCAYCGSLVEDVPRANGPARCPVCSAPLEVRVVTVPPVPPIPAELEYVGRARPAVHLGRDALDWYRFVPIVWAATILTGGVLFLVVENVATDTLGNVASVALAAVLLVVVLYVLWYYAARKWLAAGRTLSRALPATSPWHVAVARLVHRAAQWALAAWGGSIVLLVGSLGVFAWIDTQPGFSGAPTLLDSLALDLVVAAFGGVSVASHLGIVAGARRLVAGSEVPSIERRIRRAWSLGVVGLLIACWPLGVLLYLLTLDSASTAFPPPVLWVGLAGPLLLYWGVAEYRSAYREWTDLADRLTGTTSGDIDGTWTGAWSTSTLESASTRPLTPAMVVAAHRARSREVTLFAVVLVVAVVLIAGVAGAVWLAGHPRSSSPGGSSNPPGPPPPIVISKTGAVWAIPGDHYEYQSFATNRSAVVEGNFSSSSPVEGYVMDSNAYAIWQINGNVVYATSSTGNVTDGGFHTPIGSPDRWYLVVVNENSTVSAVVTWTAGCEVVFPG